jgi:phage terminase large subunit
LVINFENGSCIILKEMADIPSDPTFSRFGSSEYSCAFVDEVDQISKKAVEVLSSRLRWKVSEYGTKGRLLMSTNPSINWVRDRFVMDDDGQPPKLKEYEKYIPFSVFDNPNKEFRRNYIEQLERLTDQAERERLLYGNWDYVNANEAVFYDGFDGRKNLVKNLFEDKYDPNAALYLTFDFNIFPYLSCMAAQAFPNKDGKGGVIRIYKEILGKPKEKNNRTIKTAQLAAREFKDHNGVIFITGDPSGIREDTRSEQGQNDFSQILRGMRDEGKSGKLKLIKKAPSVSLRGEWLNIILAGNSPDGWSIEIDLNCRVLTKDFVYGLAAEDGGKDKKKVTDLETGVRYEKYHHMSDAFDYLVLAIMKKQYYIHKKGGKGATGTRPVTADYTVQSKHKW